MNKIPKIELMIDYIRKNVSPPRFKHILGTWRTALALAEKHNVSKVDASVAAILHDAGKSVDKEKIVAYVKKHKVNVPYLELSLKHNPWILHGYVSAHIAKKVFGITDKDILEAIASHTLGNANMSKLAKLIYLADITAPDRRYPTVKQLRRLAMQDLDKAMRVAVGNKIIHVISNKKWLHPLSLDTWNMFYNK